MNNLVRPSPDIWYRLTTDPVSIYKYTRDFRYLHLTDAEKEWLVTSIREVPDDDDFRRKLRSALLYSRTLSDEQREEFFDNLLPWIHSNQIEIGWPMQRFLNHYHRVKKFEDKMYKKEFAKLDKELPSSRAERSRKVAFEKARLYERNYYRCMNAVADPSQVTKEGLKRANTVALGITFGGAGSALMTYALTNYDLEKDWDWWSEIAFVIVTSMAQGYINSKWILANPKLKLWSQRLPLVLAASAAEDVGITALWSQLLGSEPPGHEEVKRMLADENFQAKLKDFFAWIEQHDVFSAHMERMQRLFDFYQMPEGEALATDVNLKNFDPEALDLDGTLSLFVQALTDYEYEKSHGLLSLGNEDYDRYAFHRGMDLIYQPAFLIASQLMYNTMCVTGNPRLGVVKAIGLFMAINIAVDGLYFLARRGLINQ